MIKVGINGFGRIGRLILRALVESQRKDIEVSVINDLGNVSQMQHILSFDSVHGKFPAKVELKEDSFLLNDRRIYITKEKNPSSLPWSKHKIDVVLECTGFFTDKDLASSHIDAGARKVIISAPAKNVDYTVVYGVNHKGLSKEHTIISNASCTTNCLAPIAKVFNDNFGLVSGFMTTIHSYTGDQRVVDSLHSDMRRAR